jgi:hypothetical protein
MWHDINVAAYAPDGVEISVAATPADLDGWLSASAAAARAGKATEIRISGNVDEDATVELTPDQLAAIATAGADLVFVARTNHVSEEDEFAAELGWT